MGYRYEISISMHLDAETPQVVFDVLKYGIHLLGPNVRDDTSDPKKHEIKRPAQLPNHPFFDKEDWENVFCKMETLLIAGDSFMRLVEETETLHSLALRIVPCAQWDTATSFIHWIAQYAWGEGYIGMFRDNHHSPTVTLLYRQANSLYAYDVTPPLPGRLLEQSGIEVFHLSAEGNLEKINSDATS